MKYIFLLLLWLLIIPQIVIAAESSPIKVDPMVRFDKLVEYEANIEIELPNDIYDRTYVFEIRFNNTIINNDTNETEGIYVMLKRPESRGLLTNWESIGFDVIKDFANQTELFDIVDTCSKYLDNVSNCFTQTNTYRDRYDELYESTLEMVNLTYHNDLKNNLTLERDNLKTSYETLQTSKETEITELQERIEKLETHRQWGWGIGIVGIGTSLFLLNKYRGFGKRKHSEQREFPKDVAS